MSSHSPCLSWLAFLLLLGSAGTAAAGATIDFRKQIAPLLQSRCLRCHGADKQRSGLRLDTGEDARKGSRSGVVIRPGASADSRLFQVVTGQAADQVVMPPRGKRLSEQEVGLLRDWIDQGAPWPAGLVLQASGAHDRHWAFEPIRRPTPPPVQQESWPHNPIDRFILGRLEQEGIRPVPQADRRTLLRRLSLDLIGLPPTPAEVEAFIADLRPDAYERQVDRLLASPHYGEKWARPWLDLCHYADSDGYLQDKPRPVAWRYRAWLVDALNRDLPFDQLTILQLAGDLLPEPTAAQLLATGFLRNTLSNREGGADLEEFRVEQVVDRTMIVGTTWLGLTVGCARCHDHKLDPLSQKELFQLYAYFDSADEVNIDAPLPGEEERYRVQEPSYRRRRAELLAPVAKDLAQLQARWEKKLLQAVAQPGKNYVWDRQWELLGLIWGEDLGEGQLEGTQIVLLDPSRRTPDQKDRLLDYFLHHGEIIDSRRFQELKLAQLTAKLDALAAKLPRRTRAPTMRQTQTPRPTHVHLRGDFRNPGARVEPGTPAVLPPLPRGAAPNRLTLARWLVSADNPLPARVTVNRFWQEFFGRGLVETSDNFGVQGERPSHPELLDWLAAEFRQGAWSMKRMHQLIVLSAAYQQSSLPRPELGTRDPSNRLVARQTPLRLSAEQIRDAALAVSGLLNPALGGPSVFPPQPASVAREGFDNRWVASTGRDRYRRGLYTFVQRTSPFAQNVTFDAPPPSRSCTHRERSNTPLQALTLLNDEVFVEAAKALAARVLREKHGGLRDRIEHAFALCLGRSPTAAERQRLMQYYQTQAALLRLDRKAAVQLSPRIDGIDPVEGGAWTGLCSVLLNLHEFITRD
jgi:hypothetical protein